MSIKSRSIDLIDMRVIGGKCAGTLKSLTLCVGIWDHLRYKQAVETVIPSNEHLYPLSSRGGSMDRPLARAEGPRMDVCRGACTQLRMVDVSASRERV